MRRGLRSAILLSAYCLAASPAGYPSSEYAPELKKWRDPFWNGWSVGGVLRNRRNDSQSLEAAEASVGYCFENGVSLTASVPMILVDTGSANLATPRIDGGDSSRPQVLGSFRFWGDESDYLGAMVGAGLPIQTDPLLKDTLSASWLLPIGMLGRLDGGWIAAEASFLDYATYPRLTNSKGVDFYQDATNIITVTLAVLFYPNRWLSPYAGWSESPPRHSEMNPAAGAWTIINSAGTEGERSRHVFMGVQLAPLSRLLVSLEAWNFIWTDVGQQARWAGQGAIRWVF